MSPEGPPWSMEDRLHRVGTLALLALAAGGAAAGSPLPLDGQQPSRHSLDDWMTVGTVASFVWSPDATTIYFTSNAAPGGTQEIFRIPAGGGEAVQLSRTPDGVRPEPAGALQLSADGGTLLFTSARLFQSYDNIFTLPVEGGEPQAVTFNDAVIETGPTLAPDGRTLAFFSRTGSGTRILVQDLAQPDTWPRFLLPGAPPGDRSPQFSPDGRHLLFVRDGDLWVVDAPGAGDVPAGGAPGAPGSDTPPEPRRVVEGAHAGGNGSPVWSPDGTRIAIAKGASGFDQVGIVDVVTGAVTPLTREPRDHGDVGWFPDGRAVVFTRGTEGHVSNEVVVMAADGTGTARVVSQGVGRRSSPQVSPDGRWIAWIETSGTRTPDIWRVPVDGGEPRPVTRSMGRIDPARLVEPESVAYRSSDGLSIPAMLYRPRGLPAGARAPVLVRLHGHPGQWNRSFDVMDQYFVERGYVVVKPNPRGSQGFGQGFHDLHIGDYGGAEFQDVLAVVPFLEGLGYADTGRMVTEGGSGGGYMSFVIATEAPTTFRAQAIRAPVSDWELLAIDRFGASGRAWTAGREPRRERSEFGGPPDEIPGEYHRRSPIHFVENVQVPQLLLHGSRDSAVPIRQSTVWVERMHELGKADLITFVEYPDEDHSLVRYRATVRDRLRRMEAFYAEHLGLAAADP